MKPIKIILIFLLFHLARGGNAQIKLSEFSSNLTIKSNIETFADSSGKMKVEDLLHQKMEVSKSPIPNFGWGKSVGWVRFSFRHLPFRKGKFLLHINSAIFDEISFYLVKNDSIISKYENIGSFTPIEKRAFPHRDFVFPLQITSDSTYTVYLRGRNQLNNLKFPIQIWEESAFLKAEKSSNLFWGLVIGVLFLISIANFIMGFLMQMRTFYYYGFYILSLIFVFLNLEGFIFEYFPSKSIKNDFFDLHHIFNYSTFGFSMLFVVSFSKISLSHKPYFERGFRVLQIFFVFSLIITILSPLWLNHVSDNFLQIWGWSGRILILCIILWCYITVFSSMKKNQMAKFFIIASIPPLLSYIIPQYAIFKFWIVQPYSYLAGFSLEVLILSVVMILKARDFISSNKQEKEANNQIVVSSQTEEIKPVLHEILSKRETEILKAFANGFTYQEIADAMFISPHTVRTHLKNIYHKLEINSKSEAVKYVIDNQL